MHDSSKLLAHRFSNNNQFYSVTINRAPLFCQYEKSNPPSTYWQQYMAYLKHAIGVKLFFNEKV